MARSWLALAVVDDTFYCVTGFVSSASCYNATPLDTPLSADAVFDAGTAMGADLVDLVAAARAAARPLAVRGPISWSMASRTRSVSAVTSSAVRPVVGIGSRTRVSG